jgi:aspartate/methionine/tyrosine aminotransferase
MLFEPYPFEKLTTLLENITPDKNYKAMTLTIGEPQFETPQFIQDALASNANELQKYPKTAGEIYLKEAMIAFNKKRFNIELNLNQIIPTFGTREVLFNFPQFLLHDVKHSMMAFTNPFYQIYEGAALATNSKVHYLNLTKENNFKPEIDEKVLSGCDFVILNFPNNPTASTLSIEELGKWVRLALKYHFVLMNDECYSEIYTDLNNPPVSLLEASIAVNNLEFKNILVINSISKRSCAPGLRSGFIAGDQRILKEYMKYRTYIGCASPLPLQRAAAAAWLDEDHVQVSRDIYLKNFHIAKEILGTEIPNASFYIWLEVDDALSFTKYLYETYNIKVLPGEFLARDKKLNHDEKNPVNPGKNYIRIALVENEENTKESLTRIKKALNEYK